MVKRIWIIGAIILGMTILCIAFFAYENFSPDTMIGSEKNPIRVSVNTTKGFQSPPMMFRADPACTGNYSQVSRGIIPLGRLKWKYKLDSSAPASPTVWEDTVYLMTPHNGSFAINASTGVLKWNNRDIGYSSGSPAIAEGKVFEQAGYFYSLNAETGAVGWRYQGGNSFGLFPAIANGTVYIGNGDKNVYAFDPETGRVRWNYTTIGSVNTLAVADNTVYLTSVQIVNLTFAKGIDQSKDKIETDNRIYALDADTGMLKWKFTPHGMVSYCGPAVADGILYVGTDYNDNNLYALDTRTGEVRWNRTINVSISSPAVAEGMVFVGSDDSNLNALDAKTGAQKWKFTVQESKMPGGIASSPAYADGVVYFGDLNGNLYALDAKTGALRWKFTAGGYIWSSPAISNGIIYFSSGDGYLYAVE
ncbi:MAG: PQQ-binding-like beta-propeller repeat protein [Methanoregula sp.]|nr:PQQ-binding-like beta-propeller repeat protein [Methanoregula sp.]